jgi:molecular chaperone GrpE
MLRRVVLSSSLLLANSCQCAKRSVCHASSVLMNEEKPSTEDTKAEASDAEKPPVEETIDSLKKELEEVQKNNADLNDQLLRALADAENIRRIARNDVQHAREFAITKFAKSLLDVSDNLRRAHESITIEELHPDHTLAAIKSLHEGVVLTDKQLQKVFREFNINPVGEVGDKFDPNVHDALFEYEDASKEAGSIGQLMKVGYLLNSRVIRPAQVGVIKGSQNSQ